MKNRARARAREREREILNAEYVTRVHEKRFKIKFNEGLSARTFLSNR